MTLKAGMISFSANETPLGSAAEMIATCGVIGKPNVALIRANDGAPPAPQGT
jgi:hypothetical protein